MIIHFLIVIGILFIGSVLFWPQIQDLIEENSNVFSFIEHDIQKLPDETVNSFTSIKNKISNFDVQP